MIGTGLVNGDSDLQFSGSQNDHSDSDISISIKSTTVSSAAAPDHGDAPDLRSYYNEIVRIVDKLYAVSILIRGTSPSFRVTRAAAHVEIDADGTDVIAEFKSIVALRIASLYPPTPTWLVQRIANLVGMRRQQFYYQRAHRRRLAKVSTKIQEPLAPVLSVTSKVASEMPKAAEWAGQSSVRNANSTRTRATIKTVETTATELVLENNNPTVPIISNVTFSEKRFGEDIFPIPPETPVGKDFECSHCFHILPDTMRKEALWRSAVCFLMLILLRGHLISDLRPYSCTSQDCKDYDQLFETRDKWMQHELQYHHSEWWCDAAHGKDSSAEIFLSEHALTQHLLVDHVHEFEKQQLPFLIARAKRPSLFPFTSCPFCADPDLDLTNIRNRYNMARNDQLEQSLELQKHIGSHLQNFSILAFLEQDEDNDEQETGTVNKGERLKTHSNLSSVSLNYESESDPAARVTYPIEKASTLLYPEPPELAEDFAWDFIGDYTPIRDRINPENDPTLANFVATSRVTKSPLNLEHKYIKTKGYVPLGGRHYLKTLAKHGLSEHAQERGSGNRTSETIEDREPKFTEVAEESEFLARITIGESDPPQGILCNLRKTKE